MQLGRQLFRSFADGGGFCVVQGKDVDIEGGQGFGPEDALVVVVLLDDSRHQAGDAHAVAAHDGGEGLAVPVQHPGLHGFAVGAAQLEDVAGFDAAQEPELALAVGGGIAGDHVAQV